MNNKNRKFENNFYLNYIRQLPCVITGRAGDDVHAHHVDVIGRQGIRNDYYTLPLKYNRHITRAGHITAGQLEEQAGEDPRDLIIFHMSMYIEYLAGRYSFEGDQSISFLQFRRKMIGKE